jgi:hypothetical protein
MHISLSQLREMQSRKVPYDLYRVYRLDGGMARLRVAENVAEFADEILNALASLPETVTVDSICVQPSSFEFNKEVVIELVSNKAVPR